MLNLTSSEKKTIYITLFVICLSALVQFIKSGVNKPSEYDYSVMDSIFFKRSYQNPDSVLKKVLSVKNENISENSKNTDKKIEIININTATTVDFEKLPYIGPVIAKRITEYRLANKRFETIQDLKKVKGIGEKTLQKLKPYISVE